MIIGSRVDVMHLEAGMSHVNVVHVHVVSSRTSWAVSLLWVLLSHLVALTCITAFCQAEWFVRLLEDDETVILRYHSDAVLFMLGLLGVCYRPPRSSPAFTQDEIACHSFGGNSRSTSWQCACVLFGSGCVLQGCCAVMAGFSRCLATHRQRKHAALLVGQFQMAAVLFQTAALLLYPFMLASPFARLHCGPYADVYYPDNCRLGWAYMLAITGTLLGYYCPFLAHFTSYNIYSPCYWTNV